LNVTISYNFPNSRIKYFFGYGKGMLKISKYFKVQSNQSVTQKIKKVKVYTTCEIDNAKFNLEFYNSHKSGHPNLKIYDEDIIGLAENGNNQTIIDVGHLDIEFPTRGLFVVIEWLMLEENKFEFSYRKRGVGKKLIATTIDPAIGAYPSDILDTFIYDGEKWQEVKNSKSIIKSYDYKYRNLAIELELSD